MKINSLSNQSFKSLTVDVNRANKYQKAALYSIATDKNCISNNFISDMEKHNIDIYAKATNNGKIKLTAQIKNPNNEILNGIPIFELTFLPMKSKIKKASNTFMYATQSLLKSKIRGCFANFEKDFERDIEKS